MKEKIGICRNCGEPFVKVKAQKYCNDKCKWQYYYRKKFPLEEIKCGFCGTVFMPKSRLVKYCSDFCAKEMNRILSKKLRFKLKREFPEFYYNELGSRGTSTNYRLIRDENGEPDFDKEREWIDKEKNRIGLV